MVMFIITFLIKSKNIIPEKCDNLEDDDSRYYTVWMVNQDTDQENESEKLHSNLISAIEVCRPLYDHRLSLSKRSEAIKNKLWNEIYVELQGGSIHYNINFLQNN